MSAAQVVEVAGKGVFRPRGRFHELAVDHVRLDDLTGRSAYESAVTSAVTKDSGCVAIIGPRGAGKSSLIAHVCRELGTEHVALRVPPGITGAVPG